MTPFLKWSGGKRWFVSNCAELLPTSYTRYIEPFLGSGAVFFHLKPKTAILSDSNSELIETYEAVKQDPDGVLTHLRRQHHKHNKKHYYLVRDSVIRTPTTRAARFS